MRELLEKRHPPLCAALDHARDLVRNGELTGDEASAFYRLLARDHALGCMTAEDHADARKPGGLVDRLGDLEKLSDEDETVARQAEIKVAVSLLSGAVDGGHIDAKAAREALALLVDLEDHMNEAGDDDGVLSSVALMSLIAPDGLKPPSSKSTAARDAPDAVTAKEADAFRRRNRR